MLTYWEGRGEDGRVKRGMDFGPPNLHHRSTPLDIFDIFAAHIHSLSQLGLLYTHKDFMYIFVPVTFVKKCFSLPLGSLDPQPPSGYAYNEWSYISRRNL